MVWKVVGTVAVVGAVVAVTVGLSLRAELELWKYPDELTPALAGKRLSVGGKVRALHVDKRTLDYALVIENGPDRPPAAVAVRYHGLVPDTLQVGGEAVATGTLDLHGGLVADAIMAKCPSKYAPPRRPVALR